MGCWTNLTTCRQGQGYPDITLYRYDGPWLVCLRGGADTAHYVYHPDHPFFDAPWAQRALNPQPYLGPRHSEWLPRSKAVGTPDFPDEMYPGGVPPWKRGVAMRPGDPRLSIGTNAAGFGVSAGIGGQTTLPPLAEGALGGLSVPGSPSGSFGTGPAGEIAAFSREPQGAQCPGVFFCDADPCLSMGCWVNVVTCRGGIGYPPINLYVYDGPWMVCLPGGADTAHYVYHPDHPFFNAPWAQRAGRPQPYYGPVHTSWGPRTKAIGTPDFPDELYPGGTPPWKSRGRSDFESIQGGVTTWNSGTFAPGQEGPISNLSHELVEGWKGAGKIVGKGSNCLIEIIPFRCRQHIAFYCWCTGGGCSSACGIRIGQPPAGGASDTELTQVPSRLIMRVAYAAQAALPEGELRVTRTSPGLPLSIDRSDMSCQTSGLKCVKVIDLAKTTRPLSTEATLSRATGALSKLLPFSDVEVYQVSLKCVGRRDTRYGPRDTCTASISLAVWDMDVLAECYARAMLLVRSFTIVPKGARRQARTWAEVFMEFGLAAARGLAAQYSADSAACNTKFPDPNWAAAFSAFVAEDTYNAYFSEFIGMGVASTDWRRFFESAYAMADADLFRGGIGPVVSKYMPFVTSLTGAFAAAHIAGPLAEFLSRYEPPEFPGGSVATHSGIRLDARPGCVAQILAAYVDVIPATAWTAAYNQIRSVLLDVQGGHHDGTGVGTYTEAWVTATAIRTADAVIAEYRSAVKQAIEKAVSKRLSQHTAEITVAMYNHGFYGR